MHLYERLDMAGGVARRSQVARSAAERRELAAALAEGAVRALGGGWLAATDADPALVMAHRLNATVSCVSAALIYGLATLGHPERPHLAVPRSRGIRRRPSRPRTSVVLHRESWWATPTDPVRRVAPIDEALGRVLRCAPPAAAVVMVDSALNKNLVTLDELYPRLTGPGSVRALHALRLCDGRSRSAIETIARLVLRRAGMTVITGVVIQGVGEVDMLVERHVVVECDGFAYHSGRREFREDRRRDRELVARGFVVLRFTWEDVVGDPELLHRDVLRALARRREH
ncbi:DUF559 domain-containing protein [Georgenia sp. AZ-5]|uniref:DUF559 domain-containing protein n=1 Tax=Georgenia sp. AZ-5 TaxID=3367526 RepID=UPI0037546940